jgi:hypothetical protein
MSILKRLALPAFVAVLIYGFLLSLPHPQINVRWQMPGELAMAANPGANGNGGNAVQGVAAGYGAGTDPGGGICLDATGTLVGLCSTILENLIMASTLQMSAATSQIFITTANTNTPALGGQFVCNMTAVACAFVTKATSPPGMVFAEEGGSGMGTTSNNFQWLCGNSAVDCMDLQGNGSVQVQLGNVVLSGVANGFGEVLTGGASVVTGAKGIGAVVMGGMPYSGTFCSVANGTTTNASPSLLTTLTTGQWNCPITSGSASATVFNISVPGAVTLTNPAICQFSTSIAAAVEPKVTSSTTLCILTYSVAPGAILLGQLSIMGNGP